MNAKDETKLKAFLIALNGLEPPLPDVAYESVHEMGVAIAQKDSDRVFSILDELTQTYPHLGKHYDAARLDLKRTYHAQERSKNVVATLEKTGNDLEETAIRLLTRFSSHTPALFTETFPPTKADVGENADLQAFPEIAMRLGASSIPTPIIKGTNIRVQTIVISHFNWEQSPSEIANEYDLTQTQVSSALAYYEAYRIEIDAGIKAEEDLEPTHV
jgi:uncharacterized protein (DUF433 family)